MECLSAVVSEVVVSLVSWYEKAHPREKCSIVLNFLHFCGLSLMSYGG